MDLKSIIKNSLEDYLEDVEGLSIDLDKFASFIENDISDDIKALVEEAVEEAEDTLKSEFQSDPIGYILLNVGNNDTIGLKILGFPDPSLSDMDKLEWVRAHWDKIDPYKNDQV